MYMDTRTLTSNLRELRPSDMEWKFAMYSASKRRDGVTLEWGACEMTGAAAWVETVRDTLLAKPVADKPVAPYSPFLSDKENIAAVSSGDELIRQSLSQMLGDIDSAFARAPEDYISGAAPKPTGYVFAAGDEASGRVLFLRRSNPFLTGASLICASQGGVVRASSSPTLRLAPTADFVLIGGVCYFLSSGVEKDFEFENRYFAIATKRLELVSGADIVSDIGALEKAAFTPRNARKFVDFDRQVVDYIAKLPVAEREEFLATYGVTTDPSGRMDASDEESCELIIDLLCCRSCLDPLGRLAVGSNITVR
jgi:hypothetical protein